MESGQSEEKRVFCRDTGSLHKKKGEKIGKKGVGRAARRIARARALAAGRKLKEGWGKKAPRKARVSALRIGLGVWEGKQMNRFLERKEKMEVGTLL